MEAATLMKLVERMDEKLDDIRDKLSELEVSVSGTSIRQMVQDKEIETLKGQVDNLRTAHNKALGAWGLLSIPGFASLIYTIIQISQK